MIEIPAEPMLAAPVTEFVLPPGWIAEPKWDGFRAFTARDENGRAVLRSRRGTDLAAAFPEIAGATGQFPVPALLDGELVVWEDGRLAFERLTERIHRRGANAARSAAAAPAHFVAFDLLHVDGRSLFGQPYTARREALEELFGRYRLSPPWTLCPSTGDPDTARTWLSWSAVGVEGCVFKDSRQRYLPGVRAWRKYRVRDSAEAIVAAVTGRLPLPGSVLLGRFDSAGRLRYAGRSTPLPAARSRAFGAQLRGARPSHPWQGRSFSAAWGRREQLDVTLVEPELVAEVSADISRDAAGRWRHPVRLLRIREDMAVADVQLFDTPPAGG
ncbi:ATP-dependent DNA ligase [Streptomyces sp. NPDC014872]|uniref:ATP-dependent DNA ligase n=1 Tax=Streptomyces sp. NPDC014872 TaxID=3364926 RepID=UPI0036FAAC9E